MPGYQDNQLPLQGGFGEADPSQEEASNGSDPQPDILSGVTDPAELDGNDSLDVPPLPGIEFNELDPEEREDLAEPGALPLDVFGPRDDSFDEALPGGGEDGLYGDGQDRLYGGSDMDGHDSGDPSGHDSGGSDGPYGGADFGAETIFGDAGQDGHEGSGEDRPYGGADFGAETIFGDAGQDGHEGSGEDGPGAGSGFGSETIFGGLNGDGIDGLGGDQWGEDDVLDGAPLSGDPNLDGNDGLDLPMGPNFGEADPSALESLPGSDLPNGMNELGGGMGEDSLLGGGTDSYWSPSGAQGSGDRTDGRSQTDDSDQVNFETPEPPTRNPGTDGGPPDDPLTVASLLDADGGSGGPNSPDVLDMAALPGAGTASLGLAALDGGLLNGGLLNDTGLLVGIEILA